MNGAAVQACACMKKGNFRYAAGSNAPGESMPSRANCQLRRRRTLSRQYRRHRRGRVSSGRAARQGTKCEHIVGLAHHCDHPSAPKVEGGLLARAQ